LASVLCFEEPAFFFPSDIPHQLIAHFQGSVYLKEDSTVWSHPRQYLQKLIVIAVPFLLADQPGKSILQDFD
jgi:hypothetical protein